jgi:signal transduction histidine kinase
VLLAKTLSSSTFKQALIAIGTFGVIASAILIYVYSSTKSYVGNRTDRAIATEYMSLHNIYDRAGRDGVIASIRERMTDKSFADNLYLLTDPSLSMLAGNLRDWPAAAAATMGWTEFRATDASPEATTMTLVRATTGVLPNGDRLVVGRDISDIDGFIAQIKTATILIIALIFTVAGVVSVLVTRRTVGRIEQINATSRAIMQSGLDKRIPLRGSNDEWDRVAENLNSMLDRIEALMGEIKQVSDNVAHDLRTPLTRMRGRLEKAFHNSRIADRDQVLISDTIADLDAVLRIFTSITRIAHIETSARKGAFRTVNLAEIAGEVVELYDAAAEQDGTSLVLAGDREVVVTGDRDLLFDAVANLVDNAIKHGRVGGHVVVRVENLDGGAVTSIADDGPGIPADQHQRVFKRFYRLEQSRYAPGNGLGLSLVAAVANLHGARIEMLDNAPGLNFKLRFSPATLPA